MRVLYVRKLLRDQERDFTTKSLRAAGFVVERAVDGIEALEYFNSELEFDCLLISEPPADMTTAKLVRLIRANKVTTPILVRADDGCGSSATAIDALEAGADDYVWTTCSHEEIISRIRALARRPLGFTTTTVEVGPVVLDMTSKTVRVHGEPVHLTNKEYEMLELMATRRGRVISKGDFLNHLYQQRDEPEVKIIDVYVCKLRRKIGEGVIENVWGRGYMIPAPAMSKSERNPARKVSEPVATEPHNLVETNWRTTPSY